MRLIAIALLAALGCGGNDGVSPATAQADCAAFISDSYCQKIVPCYSGLTQADCVAAAQVAVDCTSATGEDSAGLSTCKSQLAASTCTVLTSDPSTVTLPASCMHIFTH